MEFDKSKVYTSLNADELKPGSTVVFADSLGGLEAGVEANELDTLKCVEDKSCGGRFYDGTSHWYLAYLVEEPEEKKLYWTDLKVGDIIQKDFYDGHRIAMVAMIDTCSGTTKHIGLASEWLDDIELTKYWKKVENA